MGCVGVVGRIYGSRLVDSPGCSETTLASFTSEPTGADFGRHAEDCTGGRAHGTVEGLWSRPADLWTICGHVLCVLRTIQGSVQEIQGSSRRKNWHSLTSWH